MSDAGLNETRLEHLRASIEADVKRRLYHGAVIIVARHGRIGLQAALAAPTWRRRGHCRPSLSSASSS